MPRRPRELSHPSAEPRPSPGEQRVGPEFVEDYPWAQPTATEAVMNIVGAGTLLLARIATLTQRFGLSPAGMNVLTILEHAPEPLSPRAIAQALVVTSSTVTGLLDSLEKRGLVRRVAHPTDRRKLQVEITRAGRALVHDMGEPLIRGEQEWLSCLSPREQEQLIRLLGRVQAHVTHSGHA